MTEHPILRPRGRPPTNDATDKIVAAATELFLRNGYVATTMQDVASRFGGSKQTIYARFPDKAALFKAVLIKVAERQLTRTEAIVCRPAELNDSLENLAKELLVVAFDQEIIAMQRLVISEAERVPELLTLVQMDLHIPALRLVERVMNRFIDAGVLQGNAPELAIRFCDLTLASHSRAALHAGKNAVITDDILRDISSAVTFFLRIAVR
jgi:TetR/AcrR family transcriptional repressor of mexJK operon